MLNPPFLPNYVRCGRWQGVCAHGKTLWYPIWLSYACGLLEQHNNEVRLIDCIVRKWNITDVIDDIEKFKPGLVIIDSNFSSLTTDIATAKKIKDAFDGIKTVIVGQPAAQFSGMILKSKGVDIVARMEYDLTLCEIAQSIEESRGFESIRGISYKINADIIHNPDRKFLTSQELDDIPFVSKIYKKHLNVHDYYLDHTLYPMIQIFCGRGCPAKCTFCSWPKNLMGNKYRVRSVKNIVNELEWIKQNLPEVKEIFLEDDTFTFNNKRVNAIADEIIARRLDIVWSCNARATLDYATMKRMKDSGCRLVVVGYESGNDEILKNIKKGITTVQSIQFAADARKAKLLVLGDFIFGLPGESKETIGETKKFINKYIKPDFLQIAIASPIPGTDFYNWAKEGGFLLTDDMSNSIDENGFIKCIVTYPNLSNEDIWRYTFKVKKEYYLSVRYLLILLKRIFSKNCLHELKMFLASAKNYFKYVVKNNAK